MPGPSDSRFLFAAVAMLAVVSLTANASSSSSGGGGLTTPEATGGGGGTGLFNIRPLSIFTGHCNASIARGATIWKPVPGVVDIFFPKVVSPPPSSSSVSPTHFVHVVFRSRSTVWV